MELSPSQRLSGPEPCFPHPTRCYPPRDTWRRYGALAPRLVTSLSQLGPLPPGWDTVREGGGLVAPLSEVLNVR